MPARPTVNSGLLNRRISLLRRGEKLKVKRLGDPINSFGKIIREVADEFEITANVQPLTGKELLQFEEGDRTRQQLWVYTRDDVREFDIMTRNGKDYEIQIVEEWGPFNQARAVLKDVA